MMRPALRPAKAILFDVGNTLLHEERFDLEAGLGAVVDSAEVPALATAFLHHVARDHALHREPILAEWVRDRVPRLASMSVSEIEESIWADVVTLRPKPHARDVVSRLANDGVPVAAVSNAFFSGRILGLELARHGLADGLRFVLSSGDLHWRKPARPIFDGAISRLGVPASQVWFVGDTWADDIVGAREAGLQAVWMSDGARTAQFADVPRVRAWDELEALYDACRLGVMRSG